MPAADADSPGADRTLLLESCAAEIKPLPSASCARRGDVVGLFLNAGTLVNSGIIGPVGIDPHAACAKLGEDGKCLQPGDS